MNNAHPNQSSSRRALRTAALLAAVLTIAACDVPDRTGGPLRVAAPTRKEAGQYGPAAKERYELYTPTNWKRSDKRTAIVYVHGGAWVAGTVADLDPLISSLTRNGHVVISVGYDLGVPVENQTAQLKRAVQWVGASGALLGIDPNKIFVSGHSAGAHLSTLLAVTWGEGNPIRGAIAVAPPLDLTDASYDPYIYGIRLHGAISNSNRCTQTPCPYDVLARMSPWTHVDPKDPPLYLVIGEYDAYAPIRHARQLEQAYQQATGKNDRVWVDLVEGVDHQPGSRANSVFVEDFLKLYGG